MKCERCHYVILDCADVCPFCGAPTGKPKLFEPEEPPAERRRRTRPVGEERPSPKRPKQVAGRRTSASKALRIALPILLIVAGVTLLALGVWLWI